MLQKQKKDPSLLREIKFFAGCLFFLCSFSVSKVEGQLPINFSHITVEDGLSQGLILSITQDANGFIWIGTMDGLNRLDGNKIKIYKSFYADNFLGASIKINQLVADQNYNLWIGTNNGLYLYNSKLDSFKVFYHQEKNKNSLSNNNIKALYKDKTGNIWIGTEKGLNCIKASSLPDVMPGEARFENKLFASDNIQAIYEDHKSNIWIGSDKGINIIRNDDRDYSGILKKFSGIPVSTITEDFDHDMWIGSNLYGAYRINMNSENVVSIKANEKNEYALASNIIRKIRVDRNGKVWIGTLKGLTIYDPHFKKFQLYVHKPEDPNTLNYNSIYDIFEDEQGNMWVGSYFGGANIAASVTTNFKVYKNEKNKNSISSNVISAIVGDDANNLWIGTEAEGLNYFDRKSQKFYRYKNDDKDSNSITSNLVKTIIKDRDGDIWIGLHNGILEKVSKDRKRFKHYPVGDIDPASNSEDITAIMEDENGIFWIGKVEKGLYLFDKKKNVCKKFDELYPNQKLSSDAITCLFEDNRKNIWIGTKQGLNVFEASESALKTFFKKDYRNLLQSDYINCIVQDKEGIIWFGTYSGLTCYDPYKKQFKTFTVADGLSGNNTIGIVVDNFNNLWISTDKGITRIDSARQRFNTYNKFDGLPGNAFNYNSFYKDYLGHLFFGCFNGFVEFNPSQIQTNQSAPKLLITQLTVNSNAIRARDASQILSKDIAATQKIELAYNQNIIQVNWAVLNFIKPEKNKSAYKLVGYNADWMPSNDLSASFINLPPGKYILYLKGANNDGVWSKAAPYLTIIIHPPFWKTWWAYLVYALLFLALGYTIFIFLNSKNNLKHKLQFEKAINIKQQELHQMKMDFFTHVSHEIRTPLTLITGPSEMLLNNSLPAGTAKKMLISIKKNSERLLELTNTLLAFRKADSGFTQMKIQCIDIVAFSKDIFEKFAGAALHKSISYEFKSNEENVLVYFDPEQIEIVLSNLLSNALKFTPKDGTVTMQICKGEKDVTIKVVDNGVGIPAEEQNKIFTGFYQAKTGDDKTVGSGIGLAFTKSLIEMHKGYINFTSGFNDETGERETSFVLELKLGKDHFDTSTGFA